MNQICLSYKRVPNQLVLIVRATATALFFLLYIRVSKGVKAIDIIPRQYKVLDLT